LFGGSEDKNWMEHSIMCCQPTADCVRMYDAQQILILQKIKTLDWDSGDTPTTGTQCLWLVASCSPNR
jgi:hypothetical protein